MRQQRDGRESAGANGTVSDEAVNFQTLAEAQNRKWGPMGERSSGQMWARRREKCQRRGKANASQPDTGAAGELSCCGPCAALISSPPRAVSGTTTE